jgi:hypothetical protein
MTDKPMPQDGDEVIVTLRGKVRVPLFRPDRFLLTGGYSIDPNAEHVVSIEIIEPDLPEPQEWGARVTDANGARWLRVKGRATRSAFAWALEPESGIIHDWFEVPQPARLGWDDEPSQFLGFGECRCPDDCDCDGRLTGPSCATCGWTKAQHGLEGHCSRPGYNVGFKWREPQPPATPDIPTCQRQRRGHEH